jgi:hypothetical protein
LISIEKTQSKLLGNGGQKKSKDHLLEKSKELQMRTVTLKQADEDLKGIIQRAIRDKDETIIASDEGAVVVLDELE